MTNLIRDISKSQNKIIHLILFLLLNSPIYCYGADTGTTGNKYLFLKLKTGGIVRYALNDYPIISFKDGNVTVGNDSYLLTNLESYSFSDKTNESGIDDIILDESPLIINGTIRLSDTCPLDSIHITDIQGIEYPVEAVLNKEAGYQEINLEHLPAGAYVLTTPNATVKFIKK